MDLRIEIIRQSSTTTIGPLQLHYYDISTLSFASISPNEAKKTTSITPVTISGSGFQQTNASLCYVKNLVQPLYIPATFINSTAFMCNLPATLQPGSQSISLYMNGMSSVLKEKSQFFVLDIFADPPRLLEAKFSDSGAQLVVKFTALLPLPTNCSMIFTANVTSSFGIEPLCSWIGNTELRITTGMFIKFYFISLLYLLVTVGCIRGVSNSNSRQAEIKERN